MQYLGKYPKYLFLCEIHDPIDTPSWSLKGMNRKWYDEAFKRAMDGLPANPNTQAGRMGRDAGLKQLKMIRLLKGETKEPPF